MSRQWCQKYIFLFIQIVQEMSWNFKKCCSFFTFFICKRRKLVVKIKTSLFFSVKTSNFLAGFYQPPTIISIRGSITIFRWGTHLYMSFFLSVCLSICCAPYLRNHTSSDHNFWYTYIKWWYFQVPFSHFFKNLIFWAVREVKGQKITQNEK